MKTILEVILAILICLFTKCVLIVYEMILGQTGILYSVQINLMIQCIIHAIIWSAVLFVFIEKQDRYSIFRILLSVIIILTIVLLIFSKSPYYETDEYIYNSLYKPVATLWQYFNPNNEDVRNQVDIIFMKFIILTDVDVIAPTLIVVFTKCLAVMDWLYKKVRKV